MFKPSELLKEIQAYGRSNRNEANVIKYSRYFREGWDAYGLTHEQVEGKVREILAMPGITFDQVLELCMLLLKTGKYEETSMAIFLLKAFQKEYSKETFHELGRWFDIGITNWAHTDFICGEIMPIFFKKAIISYKDLGSWRSARNKFQRRAVPVSLIKLLKTTENYANYFDLIIPMMMDPEREVHQGLGWFLREAWKKQPEQTEAFLFKWKNKAPRLIFQYATEKMTPEQKKRFRREK